MANLRVLVVDDSALTLRLVKAFFKGRGDIYMAASNGADALRLMETNRFDLLLSDNIMPGMEGLELIKRAKVLQPQIVCILMSGVGTRRDILTALQIGVFDFVEKPIPRADVFNMVIDRAADRSRLIRERDSLLETLKQQNAGLEFSLLRLHEAFGQLRQQEVVLESDLAKAQRVQCRLLPAGFPRFDHLDLFGFYGPCDHLGGDFFHYIPLNDGRIALYLTDVAGHGVSAAMVTVTLRELMRAYLHRNYDNESSLGAPGQVLGLMNEALLEEAFDPPILATMVYAVFNPATGQTSIASAGHPRPVMVAPTGETTLVPVSGPALGTKTTQRFALAEVTLEPGGCLVLYSDGVTEALNAEGEDFTIDRLRHVLATCAGQPAPVMGAALEHEVQRHLGDLAPSDDMSFIVASRLAQGRIPEEAGGPTGDRLRPGSVKIVRSPFPRRTLSEVHGRIQGGWHGTDCIIRMDGLMTWRMAPALREFVKAAKARNASSIGFDLAACEAMDSTMLGLLLQLSQDVVIHQPGSRVLEQLHEMGILDRFTVSPEPCQSPESEMTVTSGAGAGACSDMILAAHEALMEVSVENRQRFKEVVDALRKGSVKT